MVIGYDARHNSKHFADLVAAAFLRAGFEVHLFGQIVATPMVSFGVKLLEAEVGVMVTASHNPKEDNGYKVFFQDGVQVG